MPRPRIGTASPPNADISGAAHALGMFYFTGAGCAQDPDEAALWFARAAEAGDASAQASLAVLCKAVRPWRSRKRRRRCMNGSNARLNRAI